MTFNRIDVSEELTSSLNKFKQIHEIFTAINNATGTVIHDCGNGQRFHHSSITSNFTANFTNLDLASGSSTKVTLMLIQGGTAYIPTAVQIAGAGQALNWEGGSPPSGSSNSYDVVTFDISNTLGTYTVLGSLVSYT